MNNKEFIAELASRMECSTKEASQLTQGLCQEMADRLEDEDTISIQGFGLFEVKKKLERVVISPSTKQRMLVPPKMVISFKASNLMKDQLKNKKQAP